MPRRPCRRLSIRPNKGTLRSSHAMADPRPSWSASMSGNGSPRYRPSVVCSWLHLWRTTTSGHIQAASETPRCDTLYLVDANVLSAAAPTKSVPAADLIIWMDRNSANLYLSVITIAEIQDGIAESRREGALRKVERLSAWLETLLHLYGARALPIDLVIAQHIGRLADRARGQGHAPGLADLAIAATAQHYGWTVLTRNLRHFEPLGVAAHNPFEALPFNGC